MVLQVETLLQLPTFIIKWRGSVGEQRTKKKEPHPISPHLKPEQKTIFAISISKPNITRQDTIMCSQRISVQRPWMLTIHHPHKLTIRIQPRQFYYLWFAGWSMVGGKALFFVGSLSNGDFSRIYFALMGLRKEYKKNSGRLKWAENSFKFQKLKKIVEQPWSVIFDACNWRLSDNKSVFFSVFGMDAGVLCVTKTCWKRFECVFLVNNIKKIIVCAPPPYWRNKFNLNLTDTNF